jgi:hypothetical protein
MPDEIGLSAAEFLEYTVHTTPPPDSSNTVSNAIPQAGDHV